MEIPPTAGIVPGAAPQESVAPKSPVPLAPASPSVLPSESQPPDALPMSREASSAGPAAAAGRQSEVWADRLPRDIGAEGAAGNLKTHARQPTAISTLVASLLQSLKRLHPLAPPPAKAALGTQLKINAAKTRATIRSPTLASAPKPSLAGWALGGPAPRPAALGGPTPLAARYAPSINGVTLRRP